MKKLCLILFIFVFSFSLNAQIKLHSNGRITFQTLNNSVSTGIAIDPYPDSRIHINVPAYLKNESFFTHPASAYQWINCAKAINNNAAAWVVCLGDWTTTTFYVYGKGDAYAKNYYVISNGGNSKNNPKSIQINGEEALAVVKNLEGLFYEPNNEEIPDLENNENVLPEAVEAISSDFGKRTAGLSAIKMEEFFPDAVRTDPQNRLCIDYQSVVTMLVEAIKEQQRLIEELQYILTENGLR